MSWIFNEILVATRGQVRQIIIVKIPFAMDIHRMPKKGTLKAKPEEESGERAPWDAWAASKGKASPVCNKSRTERNPLDALWGWYCGWDRIA